MIRNWENRKLIPKPIFPDSHRLYTWNQVELILDMESLYSGNRSRISEATQDLKTLAKYIKQHWND